MALLDWLACAWARKIAPFMVWKLYLLLYCFLPLYSILILFAKVVLLAFKLLSHNPFLWKERKINGIIAVIVLLLIASLVVRYSRPFHLTSPHPEWNTPCGVNLLLYYAAQEKWCRFNYNRRTCLLLFFSHFFTHLIALICSLSLNLESSFVSFPSRTAS